MTDKKLTELAAATSLLSTDILPVVVDPGGSPELSKITVANLFANLPAALQNPSGYLVVQSVLSTLYLRCAGSGYKVQIADDTNSDVVLAAGGGDVYSAKNTYTPVVTGLTNPAYVTQYGKYQRIGNLVWCQGYINISGWNAQAGAITISLPVANNSGAQYLIGVCSYVRAGGSAQAGMHYAGCNGVNNFSLGNLSATDWTYWEASASTQLQWTIQYWIA